MPEDPCWYLDYFSEPYGEVYAEHLLAPEITEREAQFVCTAMGLQPGDRVLDLPCGYGRHMAELMPLFPDIVGLDLNVDCLRRARWDFLMGGGLVRGDMRELPFLPGRFDAVVNLFNSFGYFDEAGNARMLAEMARVLAPDGCLLMDLVNPGPLVELIAEDPTALHNHGDVMIREHWVYDPAQGVVRNRTHIVTPERMVSRGYSLRIYEWNEVERLLAAAGLVALDVYGDFDGSALDPDDSARMIFLAERVG